MSVVRALPICGAVLLLLGAVQAVRAQTTSPLENTSQPHAARRSPATPLHVSAAPREPVRETRSGRPKTHPDEGRSKRHEHPVSHITANRPHSGTSVAKAHPPVAQPVHARSQAAAKGRAGEVAKARPAEPARLPATVATGSSHEPSPAPPPADPNKGSVTGLPLPRFASMRADDVNLRAGPGTRYPIEWLYKRRGLPVEIEREFEVWRLVQAPDGTKGWVHEATLMGRRDFLVVGADRPLRSQPQEAAHAVAILKPGVVGHIRSCEPGSDWCRVQVGEYRGWLKRDEFWGTQTGEAVASG
jgi:SH3-like domain-containing protein